MATETIEIVYEFTDNGSRGIKSAIGGLNALGGAVAKAAVAGLATVAAGAVASGAALLSLGSDAAEMQSKFGVVFADVGGQVVSQLNDFAEATGASRFALQGFAATMGDTLKPMGFTEAAAGDMSVEVVKLAVDLASFNNLSVDESLMRLQGGLIGNHENLLTFGVRINEAILKEQLLEDGTNNLTGAALEAAKASARWSLILAGTTDAQGDAQRTSQGWANQMKGLKATIKDTATEIGLKLLPLFEPLLQKFNQLISKALPVVVEWFDKIIAVFDGFAFRAKNGITLFDNLRLTLIGLAAIFGFTQVEGMALFDSLVQLASAAIDIGQAIFDFIVPIVQAIAEFVSWKDIMIALGLAVAVFVAGFLASIAPIVLGIGALIAGVAFLRKAWEEDWEGLKVAMIAAAIGMAILALPILLGIISTIVSMTLPILALIAVAFLLKVAWDNDMLGMKTATEDFFKDLPQKFDDLSVWLGNTETDSTGLSTTWGRNWFAMRIAYDNFVTAINDGLAAWVIMWEDWKTGVTERQDLVFTNTWRNSIMMGIAWNAFKDVFIGIKKTVETNLETMKGNFNSFKDALIGGLNEIITKINGLISAFNALGGFQFPSLPGIPATGGGESTPKGKGADESGFAPSEVAPGGGTSSGSGASSTFNTNNMTMNINTNASSENVSNNFNLMQSALGGI